MALDRLDLGARARASALQLGPRRGVDGLDSPPEPTNERHSALDDFDRLDVADDKLDRADDKLDRADDKLDRAARARANALQLAPRRVVVGCACTSLRVGRARTSSGGEGGGLSPALCCSAA